MTTPKEDAPATPSKLSPGRFEHEVQEQGYLDEADVTESAILRGLRRARRLSETRPPWGRSCGVRKQSVPGGPFALSVVATAPFTFGQHKLAAQSGREGQYPSPYWPTEALQPVYPHESA
jgi:hypothetical protein